MTTPKRLRIRWVTPDQLTPYEQNPRKNDKAVDAVADSLVEFDWNQPIVVDANMVIIAGHTRWKAAQARGMPKVPITVADHLTDEQARAYRIADNKTASLATWDNDLLTAELERLRLDNFDLEKMGFKAVELEQLLQVSAGLTEDPIPEPPAKPTTKPGDLYELGAHRLLCGDSTNADDVAKLLDGAKPFLMVTDPPYGVEYDANWRLERGLNKDHQTRANAAVVNDDEVDWTAAYKLSPAVVAYVWHASLKAHLVAPQLIEAGYELRAQIIWNKKAINPGRGHYHWKHEPCFYAARGPAKWEGGRKQNTVWDIENVHRTQGDADDGRTIHSTQKPVEAMRRPIMNHGGPEDDVYDCFGGSGTTMIAAESLGRRCFMMELSPQFCDVIVQRWESFTGEKAVRNGKPARARGRKK